MRTRPQWILLIALSLPRCVATQVGQQWWDDIEAVDRLSDDDPAAAEPAYRDLLERAPTDSQRRYVIYRLGYMAEKQDHYPEAADLYLQLLQNHDFHDLEDDWTPNGLFRLGLVLYDHLDRQQEALEVWRDLIHYYPNVEGPVHRALDGILVHYETWGHDEELVAWLASEYQALQDTDVADNLLYWRAYWLRHHLHDDDGALALFFELRDRYFETSSLRDEGDWEIVQILHEQGDYEREVWFLDTMRREREENIIFGPLVTAQIEEASYRLGVVKLENLHDPEGAIDSFETFLGRWPYSLWRDDAAYGIVRAAQALGEPARVRRAAEDFLRDFSDSRFVPEVTRILAGLQGGGA